jgi:hypothetical protein
LELPEAGDHAWASRASRHQNKTHMRIAFVASKFRLGMDPEPFALEIDFRGDYWQLRDVTEALDQAAEDAHDIDRKAKQDLFRQATEVLVQELTRRPLDTPMTKTEAEQFLMDQRLRRTEARNLLHANHGQAWRLEINVSRRGHPTVVMPLSREQKRDGGEKDQAHESREEPGDAQMRFPPCASPADGGKHQLAEAHHSTSSEALFSADSQASGRRKTSIGITSIDAGESAESFFAAAESFSSVPENNTCTCEHEHVGTDAGRVVCLDCGEDLGEEMEEVII